MSNQFHSRNLHCLMCGAVASRVIPARCDDGGDHVWRYDDREENDARNEG